MKAGELPRPFICTEDQSQDLSATGGNNMLAHHGTRSVRSGQWLRTTAG